MPSGVLVDTHTHSHSLTHSHTHTHTHTHIIRKIYTCAGCDNLCAHTYIAYKEVHYYRATYSIDTGTLTYRGTLAQGRQDLCAHIYSSIRTHIAV